MSNAQRYLLISLCLLASGLLMAGLVLPMLTLSKFWLINHSVSLLGGLAELYKQGQWWLVVLIGLFSVLLPIIKLLFLLITLRAPTLSDQSYIWLQKAHEMGRWAMLDVWVVAMLIVSVKLGALASVQIHAGFYFFAAAVLLTLLITHRTTKFVTENQATSS